MYIFSLDLKRSISSFRIDIERIILKQTSPPPLSLWGLRARYSPRPQTSHISSINNSIPTQKAISFQFISFLSGSASSRESFQPLLYAFIHLPSITLLFGPCRGQGFGGSTLPRTTPTFILREGRLKTTSTSQRRGRGFSSGKMRKGRDDPQ